MGQLSPSLLSFLYVYFITYQYDGTLYYPISAFYWLKNGFPATTAKQYVILMTIFRTLTEFFRVQSLPWHGKALFPNIFSLSLISGKIVLCLVFFAAFWHIIILHQILSQPQWQQSKTTSQHQHLSLVGHENDCGNPIHPTPPYPTIRTHHSLQEPQINIYIQQLNLMWLVTTSRATTKSTTFRSLRITYIFHN